MRNILAYLLSAVFIIIFFLCLIFFHLLQVIALNIFGSRARERVVDGLNWLLLFNFKIINVKLIFNDFEHNYKNNPIILVSNHQSVYDIPIIGWKFRAYRPKFISKLSLAKNIPSVSYNLRHSGAALIDRNDNQQSMKEIKKLGELIERTNTMACIYPEGTRSKDGNVKPFKVGGIRALMEASPSAIIMPFVIDGNYKLQKYGHFPLSIGYTVRCSVLEPFSPKGMSAEEVAAKTELAIKKELNQL